MNEQNAIKLLECLGADNADLHGDWITASCPFAFLRHKSGKDSTPSFGIAHNPTGKSGYNCFACNLKSRDVADLIMEMQFAMTKGTPLKPVDLETAVKILDQENEAGYFNTEWTGKLFKVENKFEAWPEWVLSSFYPVQQFPIAMAYLNSRGVPPWVWEKLDLRFDSSKKTICFPYRNRAMKLAGIRGRFLHPIGEFRHYDYPWNKIKNTALVWLGEHHVDYSKPVVIVEGQFDYAAIYEAYPNVMANLSTGLSDYKVKKLESASMVIGFFDNDEAGFLASKTMQHRLGEIYREVTYPNLPGADKLDPSKLPLAVRMKMLREFIPV